jgi:hypothetical protein
LPLQSAGTSGPVGTAAVVFRVLTVAAERRCYRVGSQQRTRDLKPCLLPSSEADVFAQGGLEMAGDIRQIVIQRAVQLGGRLRRQLGDLALDSSFIGCRGALHWSTCNRSSA